MKVLLVTTWNTPCGIAEHAAYLKASVERADPTIRINPMGVEHHPGYITDSSIETAYQILHLNYHAALHSQWTPEYVQRAQAKGVKVVITYHDTFPVNGPQAHGLHDVADAFIVHEPVEDLPKAIYMRQGIPEARAAWHFADKDGFNLPMVGAVGFPFPWKGFDLLAEASALAGWGLVMIAPGATAEQTNRWVDLNPNTFIDTAFVNRQMVVSMLTGCDATAFLYACANSGTSGAIRQGIAARKPVIATSAGGCRQFRDLYYDSLGNRAIRWLSHLSVETVADALSETYPVAFDPGVVRLAHQDSWESMGRRYAAIYQDVLHA